MADEKQVSSTFTSMATEETDAEAPELGIGMLGYAFHGQGAYQRLQENSLYDVSASGDSAPGRDRGAQRSGGERGGAALWLRECLHRLARHDRQR